MCCIYIYIYILYVYIFYIAYIPGIYIYIPGVYIYIYIYIYKYIYILWLQRYDLIRSYSSNQPFSVHYHQANLLCWHCQGACHPQWFSDVYSVAVSNSGVLINCYIITFVIHMSCFVLSVGGRHEDRCKGIQEGIQTRRHRSN